MNGTAVYIISFKMWSNDRVAGRPLSIGGFRQMRKQTYRWLAGVAAMVTILGMVACSDQLTTAAANELSVANEETGE